MNMIQTLEQEQIERLTAGRTMPFFAPGDTVRVKVKVVEYVDDCDMDPDGCMDDMRAATAKAKSQSVKVAAAPKKLSGKKVKKPSGPLAGNRALPGRQGPFLWLEIVKKITKSNPFFRLLPPSPEKNCEKRNDCSDSLTIARRDALSWS